MKALVTDMILPITALPLPPGTDVNSYMVRPFGVGGFANAILTFLIVALVIFLLVKAPRRYKIS